MTEGRIRESHGCEFKRHIQYERGAEESPSIAVATALAQYHGERVEETDTCLYDYIDPDALDALFADTQTGRRREAGTIEFAVEDVLVTVRAGRIDVRQMN
ncbi:MULTISPECIES: HalOD1 output domain-containing protein [Natronorubrum]|uniref:Halobacterial output domain-containing protein n=2 Tax=Natronorubrum bangense TaxID=61858 RepID=L9WQK9_9EURY|nr:HalOD1 output domain-containing protein [Natronorubrum bangense]ELY51471.1 hypothetical protein C494_03985 [Natronorubrum bangense JCM 10635]QCC54564.1 hypothetical protein DV706_08840 [Natronorubrum bangense]